MKFIKFILVMIMLLFLLFVAIGVIEYFDSYYIKFFTTGLCIGIPLILEYKEKIKVFIFTLLFFSIIPSIAYFFINNLVFESKFLLWLIIFIAVICEIFVFYFGKKIH